MLRKIQRKIEELNMIMPQDKILVGVSGGADSVCLLLVLDTLSKEYSFSLEVVHVEHGIRGQESVEDATFVEGLCDRLGVVYTKISVDVPAFSGETGMGTEEAARVLRYQAFARLAKEKHAKVALAHHMEDNAETILFQMLRGSSLTGLCGMQPVRLSEDGVTYIRPLLSVHREEIESYLVSCGMNWRTDSTNKELEYSRNFLRNVVLPQLMQLNDQAVAHINNTAEQLKDIRDFMEQETDKAWLMQQQVVAQKFTEQSANMMGEAAEAGSQAVILDIPSLMECHPAVQKEVVLRAIATISGSRKDITATHVTEVLELCKKQSGREVHLPYEAVARREFEKIHLENKVASGVERLDKTREIEVSGKVLEEIAFSGKSHKVSLNQNGAYLSVRIFSYDGKSAKIPKKTYTKWLDYDKIKQGFCIRTRKEGDYFIGDTAGHRKKLKSYFIDEKIPAAQRETMWLLAQHSLVLWLVGGRISEHIKVTENTKKIIELEYQGGN